MKKRQGLKVAGLEEIAFRQGWIDAEKLEQLAASFKHNAYGEYLSYLLRRDLRE